MSRKQKPIQQPFESTTTVQDTTGDIAALRAFNPSTALLEPQVNAQFANAERQLNDQYGAYTGIPSQVARNRLRDMGRDDLMASRSLAMAQGNTEAQALKMAQLEALANLTATKKTAGFNSSLDPNKGSTTNSLISGAASIGTAAIIA